MDPEIEEGARRQSELEAAKAAFFLSGGKVQKVAIGCGQYSIDAKPPVTSYTRKRIKPGVPTSRRPHKPVTPDEEDAIVAKIMECKANELTRTQAANFIGISTTLMRRIITDRQIDYPKAC